MQTQRPQRKNAEHCRGNSPKSGHSSASIASNMVVLSILLLLCPGLLLAQSQDPRFPRASRPAGETTALRGTVTDSRGVPLSQVLIALATPDRPESSVLTGPSGRFQFPNLTPGTYSLRASRPGFEVWDKVLAVMIGEPLMVRIELAAIDDQERGRLPRPGQSPPPPPGQPPAGSGLPPSSVIRRPADLVEEPTPERPAEVEGPEFAPLGHAGGPTVRTDIPPNDDFLPLADRWRLGLPEWDRYSPYARGDFPYVRGRRLDPYNQNRFKGDYPIFGNRWFLNLEAQSDFLSEFRRLPVVGPPSADQPGTPQFFSRGEQFQFLENLIFSVDLFRGYTSFKPFDIRFKVTPVVSLNYLDGRETGLVNIDVRRGTDRYDSHAALQEAFVEVRLAETSPFYDFVSVRAGTQFFNSDFRGFIFFDSQPGVRLFGNFKANRHQYNLAYFNLVEKDTNSILNAFETRHQEVIVANYYIQDFIKLGYTTQFNVHYNRDQPSFHIDRNGFLVRPAQVGNLRPKAIDAVYLGWTGDGHFGILNVNHAFYQVVGQERPNQISGDVFGPRNSDINAQMAALEFSVDRDWKRYRASFFYASGDDNLLDDRSRGFDSIVDNVFFAGSGVGFWNRQGVRLTGTGVGLTTRFSFNPSLRSAKEEGQANFVNPGLYLFNLGMDAELTPKLRATGNLNVLSFVHTEVLEALLFQSDIDRFIGVDLGLGVTYRPWLNNNVVLVGGAATLIPGAGFRDIYSSKSLFSSFLELRLVY